MHVCVLNMANNYCGKQHMLLCQEGEKGSGRVEVDGQFTAAAHGMHEK